MSLNMPIPIIRLEMDAMRHALALAMTDYVAQYDETLQRAIANFCTPDNLDRIIMAETDRILGQIIREEVRSWFTHGAGREVIKQAVAQRLAENTTWTPLDEGGMDG